MPRELLTPKRLSLTGVLLLGGIAAAVVAADRPVGAPPPVEQAATKRTIVLTPGTKAPPPPKKPAGSPPGVQPPGAGESEMEVLIAQALDQKTDIELNKVPIRDAIRMLAEKTGIPIEMEIGTVRFLPYGSETRVTASIRSQPLSEVLNAIVRPIGLRHVVENNKVLVRASKPLERLARRAKWAELALLDTLRSKPWSAELFQSLKIQFQDSPSDDLQVNREQLRKMAEGVGAGKAAQVLENATDKAGWTWYPADDHIVVLSKLKQMERQLEQRVGLKHKEAALKDVLLDLADQANVKLKFDPLVLAALPSTTVDRYTLSVENASVRQMLEVIAGQTGVGYVIEPDGVRITSNALSGPMSTSQPAGQAEEIVTSTVAKLRSNSFVGTITIPGANGTTYSFFLRESDLPADVNDLRKAMLGESGDRIRQALSAGDHGNHVAVSTSHPGN